MSRWFVTAYYNEPNSIEIDKPTDDKAVEKLNYIFNRLENIKKSDKYYTFEKKDLGDKYVLTISRERTPSDGESTMPMVKDILKRYKINYREI